MTIARSTTVNITYKSKDISQDIAPFLTDFTFTDNSGETADDISITLQDRNGLWLSDWFPAKGDTITCSIILTDANGAQSLPCGVYEVDQINYSSPPRKLTIKAVSCAVSHNLRDTKKFKTWENTTLQTIAGDIASDNSLSLFFKADNVDIPRAEQINESDSVFISKLCALYSYEVKFNEGKLIIYDGVTFEDNSAPLSISSSDKSLISWSFSTKAAQIYKSAHFSYHDHIKNEVYEYTHEDSSVEGSNKVLELSGYAKDTADAMHQAQRRLHEANKREITGALTLMNGIKYRAGQNIMLQDFGTFSGKFFIVKVTHKTSFNGYITSLDLRQGPSEKSKAISRKKSRQSAPPKELYYTGENYYGNTKKEG